MGTNTEKQAALWSKNFIFLFLATLFMTLGFHFIIPVIPLYAMDVLKANPAQIGFHVAAYATAALLIRPFAGFAYDTIGKKKVYLISLTFFTFLTLLYPLASSFMYLLLIRFIHGFSSGLATTGSGTIIADIVPPTRRGEGVGYFGLTHTFAMALGPGIGLAILQFSDFPYVFYSAAAFIGIAFFLGFLITYPAQTSPHKKITLSACFEKRVLSVAMLMFWSSTLFAGVVTFITIFSREIHVSNAGFFFLVFSIGIAVTRLFSGRIQDLHGPKSVVTIGYLLIMAGFVTLSLTKNNAMLVTAALLLGLGNGSMGPAMQAMIIDMVDPQRRGVATSTYMAASDLGIAGGAVFLGWVAEVTSLSTMFFLSGISLLVPLCIFHIYTIKDYQAKALSNRAVQL